jgi:hypothetical protein
VLKALLEHKPLPPSVLLDAARAVELDAAAIARLRAGSEADLAPRVIRGTPAELLPKPSGRYVPAAQVSKTIGPRFKNLSDARALYDDVIAQTAGRLEVGIWQTEAGQYVVRLGQRAEVGAPSGWTGVQHYHPNLPDIRLWRMPAPADFHGLRQRAERTGQPAAEIVEYPLPDGRRGRASYTANPDGSVMIEFTDAAGRPLPPKKFDSLAEYDRYYQSHKVYADPATARGLIEDLEASSGMSGAAEDALSTRTATRGTRRPRIAAERDLAANEKKLAPELLELLRPKKLPAYLYRQLLADGDASVRRFLFGTKQEREALVRKLRARDDAEQALARDKPLSRPRDEFAEDLPARDPSFDELSADASVDDILAAAEKPQGTFSKGESRLIGVLEEKPELAAFRPVLRAQGYTRTVHRSQFDQLEWLRGTFQGNRVPDFLALDSANRILVGDITASLQSVIPNEFGAGVRLHFEKTEELATQLLQSLKGRPGFVGCEIHAMDVVRSSTKQMKPKFIGKVEP